MAGVMGFSQMSASDRVFLSKPLPVMILASARSLLAVCSYVSLLTKSADPFRVSLFPVGGGQHDIRIKAKVLQETSSKTGDGVGVRKKAILHVPAE
jgi:hypothetical protein